MGFAEGLRMFGGAGAGDCGPSRLSDAQDCEKDRNRPGRK